MQSDAEHQQDDAELGELCSQRLVRDKAGRERTYRDTREQIADQRLDAQPLGDRAEDKSKAKARDDGGDKRCFMRHLRFLAHAC